VTLEQRGKGGQIFRLVTERNRVAGTTIRGFFVLSAAPCPSPSAWRQIRRGACPAHPSGPNPRAARRRADTWVPGGHPYGDVKNRGRSAQPQSPIRSAKMGVEENELVQNRGGWCRLGPIRFAGRSGMQQEENYKREWSVCGGRHLRAGGFERDLLQHSLFRAQTPRNKQ